MRLRIYLDTSVISARIDDRDAARQELTEHVWESLHDYDPHISPLVLAELQYTTNDQLRARLLESTASFTVLPWTGEMEELARRYVSGGAFGPAMLADARHVAAAVVSGIPILLSWNFRHLVNRTRRIRVNLVNSQEGYGQIEIIAPPELS